MTKAGLLLKDFLPKKDFLSLEQFFLQSERASESFQQLNRQRKICKIPKALTDPMRERLKKNFLQQPLELELLRGALYFPGDYFSPHVDTIHYENHDPIPHRKISGIYLVKNAVQGGKFLLQGKEISLVPNDVFYFNSDLEHEVTPIDAGVRASVFFFLSVPAKKDHALAKKRMRKHVAYN